MGEMGKDFCAKFLQPFLENERCSWVIKKFAQKKAMISPQVTVLDEMVISTCSLFPLSQLFEVRFVTELQGMGSAN